MHNDGQQTEPPSTAHRHPCLSIAKRIGFFLLGAAVAGPALCLYLAKRSQDKPVERPGARAGDPAEQKPIKLPESVASPAARDEASTGPENVRSENVRSENVRSDEAPTASAAPPAASPHPLTASTLSDRFHKPTCRWARQISGENRITFQSRESAIEQGYMPCGSCTP